MFLLDKNKRKTALGTMLLALFIILSLLAANETIDDLNTKFSWIQEKDVATSETYKINQQLKNIGLANFEDRYDDVLTVPLQINQRVLNNRYIIDKVFHNTNNLNVLLTDGTMLNSLITDEKRSDIENTIYNNKFISSKTIAGTPSDNDNIFVNGPTMPIKPIVLMVLFSGILGAFFMFGLFENSGDYRGFLLKFHMNRFIEGPYVNYLRIVFGILVTILFFGNSILYKIPVLSDKTFMYLYYGIISILLLMIDLKIIHSLMIKQDKKETDKYSSKKKSRGKDADKYEDYSEAVHVFNRRILEDDWDESENELNITFDDIAGLEEAKETALEIKEFIFNKEKYLKRDLEIPMGTLLNGPPGNGKTRFAEACANEFRVPLYSINGSEFVEMFVGVGAGRVRGLFGEVRKQSKGIVLIDEIDAFAKKRGGPNSSDEREQTLNQLMVELDGIKKDTDIMVIATTNRAELLDPAVKRPGRLTEQITVPNPDFESRKEIAELFIKKTGLEYEVDLEALAYMTDGFSGAQLEFLVKKANLRSMKDNRENLNKEDFIYAFKEIVAGKDKKKHKRNSEIRDLVAYHEAGHALMFYLTGHIISVMSVIPTTKGAGGFVIPKGRPNRKIKSKKMLLEQIMISLGGRVAEEVKFGEEHITIGAGEDLEKVSKIIRTMTLKYAMFKEISLFSLSDNNELQLRGSEEQAKVHRFMEDKLQELLLEISKIFKIYSGVLDDIKTEMLKSDIILEDESNKIIKESIEKYGLPSTLKEIREKIKEINKEKADSEIEVA